MQVSLKRWSTDLEGFDRREYVEIQMLAVPINDNYNGLNVDVEVQSSVRTLKHSPKRPRSKFNVLTCTCLATQSVW